MRLLAPILKSQVKYPLVGYRAHNIARALHSEIFGSIAETPEECFIIDMAEQVFGDAMRIRVEMEMLGHADYDFEFAREGV